MSNTTLYHTSNRHTEDSGFSLKDGCTKKKVCNICNGSFSMTRGCELEKRCPACRFLNLQRYNDGLIGFNHIDQHGEFHRKYKKIASNGIYVLTDERVMYSELAQRLDDSYVPNNFQEELGDEIEKALQQLNTREYYVLKLRLGLFSPHGMGDNSYSLVEVGKERGLSKERVRQIESSAFKKLRHPKFVRTLEKYINWKED